MPPPSFLPLVSVPSVLSAGEKEEEEECVICIQQRTALAPTASAVTVVVAVVIAAVATDQLTDELAFLPAPLAPAAALSVPPSSLLSSSFHCSLSVCISRA